MNVLVACGPFTTSDTLTFDPLLDLINIIIRDRPDVCLLVSKPFLMDNNLYFFDKQSPCVASCLQLLIEQPESVYWLY